MKAQGEMEISQCTAQFNQIVNDTEQQLAANGYSTAIIQQYKDYFDKQMKTGRDALDVLMK